MNDIAAPTAAAVPAAKTSPAQVIQQLQPSISPSSDQSGYRAIARPNLASKSSLEIELAKGAKAWRKYRSINDRDAVYIYLASVFDIVMRWQRLDCALKKSRAALRLRSNPPQMKAEPFSIMIFCTADPRIVDAKTRSKWSRVLRYAAQAKPPGQRLVDFVKSRGGINECARKFTRISG